MDEHKIEQTNKHHRCIDIKLPYLKTKTLHQNP